MCHSRPVSAEIFEIFGFKQLAFGFPSWKIKTTCQVGTGPGCFVSFLFGALPSWWLWFHVKNRLGVDLGTPLMEKLRHPPPKLLQDIMNWRILRHSKIHDFGPNIFDRFCRSIHMISWNTANVKHSFSRTRKVAYLTKKGRLTIQAPFFPQRRVLQKIDSFPFAWQMWMIAGNLEVAAESIFWPRRCYSFSDQNAFQQDTRTPKQCAEDSP